MRIADDGHIFDKKVQNSIFLRIYGILTRSELFNKDFYRGLRGG